MTLDKEQLKPGLQLQASDDPLRIVELVDRVDPWGRDVTPTWRMRNVVTGHISVSQESNVLRRYNLVPEPTA